MGKYRSGYRENVIRQQWFKPLPPIKELREHFWAEPLERDGVPPKVIKAARRLATMGPLRYPSDDDIDEKPLSIYEWCALSGMDLSAEERQQQLNEIQYWKDRNWEGMPRPDFPNLWWIIHPISVFLIMVITYSFLAYCFGGLLWEITKFVFQGICFPFTLAGVAMGVVSEDYGADMGIAVGMFVFAAVIMVILRSFK